MGLKLFLRYRRGPRKGPAEAGELSEGGAVRIVQTNSAGDNVHIIDPVCVFKDVGHHEFHEMG